MIIGFAILLVSEVLGEALVSHFSIPIPGTVVGLALLAMFLLFYRRLPEGLEASSDGLLRNLNLFFIPGGVGVMAQWDLLQKEWLILILSLVISTLLGILVTGWVMAALLPRSQGEPR